MLLKKQTVWLLTMLSLVVVLSVYYITSPTPTPNELAMVESEGETNAENEKDPAANAVDDASAETVEFSGDEMFETMRLDMDENRSRMIEELTAKVASTELTAAEKNAAYEEMQQLKEISMKEEVIEQYIISMGFSDALVRAEGSNVKVSVKADEHDAATANSIIQLVQGELEGHQIVAVDFQPTK